MSLHSTLWGLTVVGISLILAWSMATAITELALVTAELIDATLGWFLSEF